MRLLEGNNVIGRPGPLFFVGCPDCRWLEARRDALAVCESGRHEARLMEVKYTCNICGWSAWCDGPVACGTSRSHELIAEDARPIG